jgi:hypothetical protein
MIQAIATAAFDARKFGLVKAEEGMIKMLTAHEQGFPLTSSFQSVHVINGIPSLSPKAIWAKILIHPQLDQYIEERLVDAKEQFVGFRITLSRKNGVKATRSFTLEDAKRAGLVNKDNWKGYPENMCFWRALGFVEDVVFPDVTLGMSRADELGAVITPDGEIIEGSWEHVPTQTPPKPSVPDHSARLQTLIDQYGPTAVMAANNDMIPGTVAEIDAVAAKLAEQTE